MSANFGPTVHRHVVLLPQDQVPRKVCSVFFLPMSITHWSSSAGYEMPAKPDDKPYAYFEVGPGTERRDLGGDHLHLVNISSKRMALDIIGLSDEGVDSDGRKIHPRRTSVYFQRGFFVPDGDEPTELELKAAKARMENWARQQVIEGDKSFDEHGNASHVDSNAKASARYLRIKRDYAEGFEERPELIQCPKCKEDIKSGAQGCRFCGAEIVYQDGKPYWGRPKAQSIAELLPTQPPPMPQVAKAGNPKGF